MRRQALPFVPEEPSSALEDLHRTNLIGSIANLQREGFTVLADPAEDSLGYANRHRDVS